MTFSLTEMWHTMGLPAKIVGAFLVTMGLASLTVFIERLIALNRSRREGRAFAVAIADDVRAANVEAVLAQTEKHKHGHLARLVQTGLATYWEALKTEEGAGLRPVERTRRHLERQVEDLVADLKRGLPVLASVGSVAPFVGLLGTVVGIISAFQGIAATGSGGLSSVAAGISEALVETALGLAVAIPAVLAFNYLSTGIAHDEMALASAAGELIDTIEGWGHADANGERHERVA